MNNLKSLWKKRKTRSPIMLLESESLCGADEMKSYSLCWQLTSTVMILCFRYRRSVFSTCTRLVCYQSVWKGSVGSVSVLIRWCSTPLSGNTMILNSHIRAKVHEAYVPEHMLFKSLQSFFFFCRVHQHDFYIIKKENTFHFFGIWWLIAVNDNHCQYAPWCTDVSTYCVVLVQ